MKAEEILKAEDINEEDCGVCQLHNEAYKKLQKEVLCPYCSKPLVSDEDLSYRMESVIVGETNYYTPDQNIERMFVTTCEHCDETVGFKTISVQYNANHDIYYTGGKDYIVNRDEIELTQEIRDSIKQFTDRLKKGENLDAWNLETWIKYGIEHMVAEILYKHGMKF